MGLDLSEYLVDWLNSCHRTCNPLKDLEQYDIRVSTDSRYPNLFNLKYGSVVAEKTLPLVMACRGAVVERVDNDGDHSPYFRLVAYAFDRFFNIGEKGCHDLVWETTKAYEKKDGSLCKCFYYGGDWLVSTSGSVAAASEVGGTGITFAELFWQVFSHVGYSKEKLDKNLCYIFELCHRANKIVVDYKEPELPLLAVRDRTKGFIELPLERYASEHGFSTPESYLLNNPEDVARFVNSRDSDHEGVVLFDGFGRAKSKSDLYCQLHRAVSNGSPDFAELFLEDNLDEFLLHFPEFSPKFNSFLQKLSSMGEIAERMVNEYSHLGQKEFAIKVMEEAPEVSAACFNLRAGKSPSFWAWVEAMTPQQLNRLLKG